MPVFTATLTLTGGADNIATLAAAGLPGAVKKGIRQLTLQGVAGNAAAVVGKSNVATVGITIAAASIAIINIAGPFSGNASTNLDEWFIKGTAANTFNMLLITP